MYTMFFAVVWFGYTPHDGRRVANSEGQRQIMEKASGGLFITDAERALAAEGIWGQEKGFAGMVIFLIWLSKVCPWLSTS